MNIDYELLADAVRFYRANGMIQIEVPWLVPPEIDDLTRPFNAREFSVGCLGLNLVASGEQGFLSMLDSLTEGVWYFTVSPCFRDDASDDLHQRQFVKLEIGMKVADRTARTERVAEACDLARTFLNTQFDRWACQRVTTRDGYDLVAMVKGNPVELGSFGFRSFGKYSWVYGTGLALPRFSICYDMWKGTK